MRFLVRVLIVVSAFSPGAAFAEDAKNDAGSDRYLSDADSARFVGFFDQIVDAVMTHKDKCDATGDAVNKLVDDNREILEIANDAKANGKQLPEAAQAHVRAGVMKMKPNLAACAKNEKVHTAFKRLDTTKKS